jgi:hypothetical protein
VFQAATVEPHFIPREETMKTTQLRIIAAFLLALLLIQPAIPVAAAPPAQAPTPPTRAEAQLTGSASTLSTLFRTNLIPDGDAELDPLTHGWVDNEGYTRTVAYGDTTLCGGLCVFPTLYDPGPEVRGKEFFFEGLPNNSFKYNGTNMWIKDRIDLAPIRAAIDTGRVGYTISGYFGGDGSNPTAAQLHMFFDMASGPNKGEVTVGNVTAADRHNKTGMLYREATGVIPPGTEFLNFVLQTATLPGVGVVRTGFADNLSLVLEPPEMYLPAVLNAGGGASPAPSKTGIPAPSNVHGTANGLTRMDVSWTDNSKNETGFEVDRQWEDGTFEPICYTKSNEAYCLDIGQRPSGYFMMGASSIYTYRVQALGQGLNSDWATGTGTTNPPASTLPIASETMKCSSIDYTSTQVTLVWTDPYSNETDFYIDILIGSGDFTELARVLENGTSLTVIDLSPGMPVRFRIRPHNDVGFATSSCVTTAVTLPGGGSNPTTYVKTLFNNKTSYPVISLVVDGWEQFPVRPLAILSGSYYEMDGLAAGTHTWSATTGFWDDWGQRFEMYQYSGTFTQPASGSYSVDIPEMTINDILSVPPDNVGYWEGYYWDANITCHTAAFKFKQDGTYIFYVGNKTQGTGTYSDYQRLPNIFSLKFSLSGLSGVQAFLIETHGQFDLNNGPDGWKQITYVFKPQGYVYNPFCP